MEKSRVLANIDPDLLKGDGVVDFNIMFSSKTFRILQQIEAIKDMNAHRSLDKQIGYVVINNTADSNTEIGTTYSRRGGSFKALTIPRDRPETALEEVHKLDAVEGFKDVIIWDELQFLDLNIISIILKFKKEGRIQWLAGLSADFRGEPFFHIQELSRLFSHEIINRPSCTIQLEGRQCSEPAIQTLRMIQKDNVNYPGKQSASFYKKENGQTTNELVEYYVYAPYWHKTQLPRGAHGIEYTVACSKHALVPRKEETLKVMNYIKKEKRVKYEDIYKKFPDCDDLTEILKFAVAERGINYDKEADTYYSYIPN